jgi:hypothetical protein
MNTAKKAQVRELQPQFPSLETIQQELSTAKSIDDFFGKQGIFARLFASTLETMLEAELSEHLGYEKYEAKGRNSGNSHNGKRPKQLRTSTGDTTIQLPRDRNSEFSSKLLAKHQTSTNELEEKILALYGKGISTATSRICSLRPTGSRYQPIRLVPLLTKCGRWSKPGRIDHWRPSIPLFIWMDFTSSYADKVAP